MQWISYSMQTQVFQWDFSIEIEMIHLEEKKKKESTALPGSPKEVSMYVIKLP